MSDSSKKTVPFSQIHIWEDDKKALKKISKKNKVPMAKIVHDCLILFEHFNGVEVSLLDVVSEYVEKKYMSKRGSSEIVNRLLKNYITDHIKGE